MRNASVEQLFKAKKNSDDLVKEFSRKRPEDPLIDFWVKRKETRKRISAWKTRKDKTISEGPRNKKTP